MNDTEKAVLNEWYKVESAKSYDAQMVETAYLYQKYGFDAVMKVANEKYFEKHGTYLPYANFLAQLQVWQEILRGTHPCPKKLT